MLPAARRTVGSVLVVLLTVAGGLSLPNAHAQSPDGPVALDEPRLQALEFRSLGPTRGGRVTAVAGHAAHPHTFYMGAAGAGGVWKTTTHGQNWTNLTQDAGFRSTAIGAIQVAPSDTSVVYVGTGSDAIRANVTVGGGMYRTTDAGATWEDLGLPDAGQIGAIEIHPDDPDRAYVAAIGHPFKPNDQRGVYRTTDGGATWEQVLFASDSTGAVDLELHPTKPNVIYAALWRAERKPWTIISGARAEDGLYKSTDGGETWTQLTDPADARGLPTGLVGKIDLAVTRAAPDRVYALVEAPGEKQGLYRSDDAGASWTQMSDHEGIMTRPFYFTNVEAHPTRPDEVHVGNVRYYVSTDGGQSFKRRRATHADTHDFWFNPETPRIRIHGNDGGATVSLDGGTTYSTQHNQPTAELYQVNVDERFPYWLYAGQQDNSTIAVPSRPPAESAPAGAEGWWHAVGGCETGPVVPQPNTPVVFANCKGRFGKYNARSGQEKQYWVGAEYMYGQNPAELKERFQRVVPIELSPHDSTVVYHASHRVHRTTNGGVTWTAISPDLTANKPQYQVASGRPITRDITGEEHYSTLYTVRVSPHSPDVIWTGANDGPVHVTRDGGDRWTDVTPEGLPPNGRVDAITPSPHTPGTAYIAVQRRLLGDFAPYVYRTTDYGQSWTRLTPGDNGLPADHPVRVVREDPEREGLLYAGTDYGLYVSMNDGEQWQRLDQGLPRTVITDIRLHRGDLVLSTMGRGFWMLDDLTPLRQMTPAVAEADRHLFTPRTAHRMRYWSGQGGAHVDFPPAGATVDFYLDAMPDQPVTLSFLTDDGTVVRRFRHAPEAEAEEADAPERAMRAPRAERPAPGDLSVEAGHNRFTWDLHHPGPVPEAEGDQPYFGAGDGPMVAPGAYQVRLTVGDWSQTRPLEVAMDPRVKATGTTVADLEEQEALNLKIRDAIGSARQMVRAIDTMRTRVEAAADEGRLAGEEAEAMLQRLDAVHSRLATPRGMSYPPPKLIDQLEYLYYMTTSADQKLGGDAFTRYETLKETLDAVRAEWEALKEGSTLSVRSEE
jgi:photosystem II stability/assembly factor-like uncharacterized protein